MNTSLHKHKSKVIGFQVETALLAKIDRVAKGQGISRSDVLRIIVNRHFETERSLDKVAS